MQKAATEKLARLKKGPAATIAGQAPDLDTEFKRRVYANTPMGKINDAALKDLAAWVPELFPAAELHPGTGAWRIKSADLGRPNEEDLSLAPNGIKDWGVHDLGDPREGGRSAIDIVMEWTDATPKLDNVQAAEWLADKLSLPFDSGSGSGPGGGAGAAPDAGAAPAVDLDVFDAGDEKGDIEPRQWLLGTTFCRGYLSGLVSGGGSGKTTVRIFQLLACATGRPLSGEHVFVRSKVLIVCLEDDLKELRRRVLAARMKHLIGPADVKGWLFLTGAQLRLKIAELDGKRVKAGGLYWSLSKLVDDKSLDLVCLDPAIKGAGWTKAPTRRSTPSPRC